MKNIKSTSIIFCLLIFSTLSCSSKKDGDLGPFRSTMKIVLMNSLPSESSEVQRKLPESFRELCSVLVSDSIDCNRIYIFDPTLLRLDIPKEFSLKTEIKKGGAKDIKNEKVIGKLIQKNFDNLEIPKEFLVPSSTSKDASKLLNNFIADKAKNDSIIIYYYEGDLAGGYLINGRKIKTFTNISTIRKYMQTILCKNEKTNFTLLINPPLSSTLTQPPAPTPPSPATSVGKPTIKTTSNSGSKEPHRHYVDRSSSSPGILTIIKGSEGCDICTRYYSATDDSGQTHEVREKNSTHCCPCGKIFQMNGRNYRMNCDGNPRVEAVE